MLRTFVLYKRPLGTVIDQVTVEADSPIVCGRVARAHFAKRYVLDDRLGITLSSDIGEIVRAERFAAIVPTQSRLMLVGGR